MKRTLIALLMVAGSTCFAQAPGKGGETTPAERHTILRHQVFGEYTPVSDVRNYAFDSTGLVVFTNGNVITKEEFLHAFNSATRKDSSQETKTQFLNEFILGRQKVFEAMDLQLDTSTAFQLEFLKYKQDFITPYLNEGYTRVQAEALPHVRFSLRQHYSGMLIVELMRKEIWSKGITSNLRAFFDQHPELYQGQSFEISRTKVVHDYNKQLEAELMQRIQGKFVYATNAKLAAKL
jgi:hypothetical protein